MAGWLMLALCLLPGAAQAQDERHRKIEAAYLYNFFNYITWPGYTSPQGLTEPTICFYGNDPVEPYLEYVREKMAGERTLTTRRLQEGEKIEGCNLLFMRSGITRQTIGEALRQNILLVTEPEDTLERGGMIELLQQEERLVISINQSLLSSNGFQISSRLLELAQRVK